MIRTLNPAFRLLLGIVVISSLACACRKEDPFRSSGASHIMANVEVLETKAQPGGSAAGPLLSERVASSADGFELVEYVYENNTFDSCAGRGIADQARNDGHICNDGNGTATTKGAVVTSSGIDAFGMLAYAEDVWFDNTIRDGDPGSASNPNQPGRYFDSNVSRTSGGSWAISGEPKWLNNVPMTFWSWKYVKPSRTSANAAGFEYTVKPNVSEQEDLIFAYNNETRRFNDKGEILDGKDEKLNIHFYHALSAIQFFTGEIPSGYRIKTIYVENVSGSTSCSISGGTPLGFTHSPSSTVSFSQGYDTDDPSVSARTGTTKYLTDDAKTFFLVPQVTSDAAIKVDLVSLTNPADIRTREMPLSVSWEAGKFYVYKIDIADEISIICDDQGKADDIEISSLEGLDVTGAGQPVSGQYCNLSVYVYYPTGTGTKTVTIAGQTATSAGSPIVYKGRTYVKYSVRIKAEAQNVNEGEDKIITVTASRGTDSKTISPKLPIWGIQPGTKISSETSLPVYPGAGGTGLSLVYNSSKGDWLYNNDGSSVSGRTGGTGDTAYDYSSLLGFSRTRDFTIFSPMTGKYVSGNSGSLGWSSSGTSYSLESVNSPSFSIKWVGTLIIGRWNQDSAIEDVGIGFFLIPGNSDGFDIYPVTLVNPRAMG